MNIELLNVRISITKNEVTVDAIGKHKKRMDSLLCLLCNSKF